MSTTAEQLKAALAITIAVTEAIREAGRIPEGTLYASLVGKVDFPGFEKMIGLIVGSGLVEKRGHELIWIGPILEAKCTN